MENLTDTRLGPYRVVALLGEGGMAAVYKAYQPAMDRYVALKVLSREFAANPKFVGRFQQEARVVAQLQHIHIVPVHDYGEAEGYAYIVMPLVQGGTLADRLRSETPVALAQTVQLLAQVGDALDFAHARGVVHRDVKPSNVLIDERGNALLGDFGIARIIEDSLHYTLPGGIVGTPAYMSPEQGQGQKAEARSDIYALGVVLYQLATGRLPFQAESPMAILLKHIHEAPLPPRELNPDLPEALEQAILRALAKNPDDRYPTAGAMAQAVREAVPAAAVVSPPPRPATPAAGEAPAARASDLQVIPMPILPARRPAEARAEVAKPDSALRALLRRWRRRLMLIFMPIAFGLTVLGLRPCGWLDTPSGRSGCLRVLAGHTQPVTGLAFSPDGSQLASSGEDGSVRLWDPETGQLLLRLKSRADRYSSLAFSPKGNFVAAGANDGTVQVGDPETGELLRTLGAPGAFVSGLAFSPDEVRLAAAHGDGTLQLWDTASGRLVRALGMPAGGTFTNRVAFSPNGLTLASIGCARFDSEGACAASEILVWEVGDEQPLRALQAFGRDGTSGGRVLLSLAFSPDGQTLAAGSNGAALLLWEPDIGQAAGEVDAAAVEGGVPDVAFSPDGRWLAAVGDRVVSLWDAGTLEFQRSYGPVPGSRLPLTSLAFGPDGRILAAAGADGRIVLWAVRPP